MSGAVASRLAFDDVEFGDELPVFRPDVGLPAVCRFCDVIGQRNPRFTDHAGARKQGLPGAIVPGIMSQALLGTLIHRWGEAARIVTIDTVFRAPVLVDTQPECRGVVTHIDADVRQVELDLTIVDERGQTRVLGTARVQL
jgi:acyl dehydratase